MMTEDVSQKVRRMLFGEGLSSLAVLLDLASLLPESLLMQAIVIAQRIVDQALRGLVLAALAKRLPKVERDNLLEGIYVPPTSQKKKFTVPEGARARRLMARLSEEERYELFAEMFDRISGVREEFLGGKGKGMTAWEPTLVDDAELIPVDSDVGGTMASGIRPRGHSSEEAEESSESADSDAEVPGGYPEDDESSDVVAEGPAPSDDSESDLSGFESMPADSFEDSEDDFGESASDSFADSTGGTKDAAADSFTVEGEVPDDVVNLGFAPTSEADNQLSPDQSLACNSDYYLWLNVGYPEEKAIGKVKSLGVKKLPKEARLKVALFSFENELEIIHGEDVGELQILSNGKVKVAAQPTKKPKKIAFSPKASPTILDKYLFFPVKTPKKEGLYRLRSSIYCEHILVQSQLITAQVTREPLYSDKSVEATIDYALSQTLSPAYLASVAAEPHRLSMMLNSSEDGSYNIRFFGGDDAAGIPLVKDDSPIDADEIRGFLDWARSAMHKVAWDREEEWDAETKWPYRYQKENFDSAKLAKDLAYLARAGGRIYWGILDNLKFDNDKLEELMSVSGLVQIGLKLSPPAVLPAAIIYDYAWDSDAFEDFDNTPFTLCETFQAGIEAANNGLAPLEECLCFKGQCSLKARIKKIQLDPAKSLRDLPPIICPSGFWGYRHALGFPLTVGNDFDADPVITYEDQLRVVAAVSTDPELIERDEHIARLKVLTQSVGLDRDESYSEVLKRLKATKPHLIYFYCHGGIRLNKLPYLELGIKDRFAPENFMKEGIRWASNPRPLVFINGCHTTSLNPEIALNFVTPLVQLGGASGVIGTEITIFEPLAVKFAEECLKRFLGAAPYKEGMAIGHAVRGARLELLRRGNPLGLVYIPFVIASLRMVRQTNPN